MDFLEKLDYLMSKHNLNKNSLSRECDIPYTTIDNWYKRGYEGLKLPTLRKLADFFNTGLDYWARDEIINSEYGKTAGFEFEFAEMEHIKKYRNLDYYGKEVVDAVLTIETRRIESNTIIESNREITATDERTVINRMKKSPDYLMNRAAHLNKDATPEQIQQDNDMMDDETIWGD